jgi:hypothetical protein
MVLALASGFALAGDFALAKCGVPLAKGGSDQRMGFRWYEWILDREQLRKEQMGSPNMAG